MCGFFATPERLLGHTRASPWTHNQWTASAHGGWQPNQGFALDP